MKHMWLLPLLLAGMSSLVAGDVSSAIQDDVQRIGYEAGIIAYTKRLASNPNDTDTLARLGQLQYRLHRFPEAEAPLQRALKLNPEHGLAHATLALVRADTHDLASAIKHLTHAIRVQPDRDDFYFNLAIIYATATPPKPQAAREAYKRALQLGAEKDPDLERLLP